MDPFRRNRNFRDAPAGKEQNKNSLVAAPKRFGWSLTVVLGWKLGVRGFLFVCCLLCDYGVKTPSPTEMRRL